MTRQQPGDPVPSRTKVTEGLGATFVGSEPGDPVPPRSKIDYDVVVLQSRIADLERENEVLKQNAVLNQGVIDELKAALVRSRTKFPKPTRLAKTIEEIRKRGRS